jgi:hypothetical protein
LRRYLLNALGMRAFGAFTGGAPASTRASIKLILTRRGGKRWTGVGGAQKIDSKRNYPPTNSNVVVTMSWFKSWAKKHRRTTFKATSDPKMPHVWGCDGWKKRAWASGTTWKCDVP